MENKDMNIIVNLGVNKISLQSTEDEVTGGYYDGEGTWHEFGGGGGSAITPMVHAKLIFDGVYDSGILDSNLVATGYVVPYGVVDNKLYDQWYYINTVHKDDEFDVDFISLGDFVDPDTVVFALNLPMFGSSSYDHNQSTLSDLVNIEYDSGNDAYIIIDPTKNASCTIHESLKTHGHIG